MTKPTLTIVAGDIGTENVEINLARIRDRVLAGGHDVPEVDVRRRCGRSFVNLAAAISRADHTILFDNSTEEGYRLIHTAHVGADASSAQLVPRTGFFRRAKARPPDGGVRGYMRQKAGDRGVSKRGRPMAWSSPAFGKPASAR